MPPASDGLPIVLALAIIVALVARQRLLRRRRIRPGRRPQDPPGGAWPRPAMAKLGWRSGPSNPCAATSPPRSWASRSPPSDWVGSANRRWRISSRGWFAGLRPPFAAIGTHGLAVAIAFTIITTLHIVLGELVPKAIGTAPPRADLAAGSSCRWPPSPGSCTCRSRSSMAPRPGAAAVRHPDAE